MNKNVWSIWLCFLLLPSLAVSAETYTRDEILTIDEPVSESLNLEFSDADELVAKMGEFKVLSTILMSNLSGERWATVTIKNVSSHQRLLDREHIIAIFADGEKRYPVQAEHKFSGNEEVTMIISFGKSKFPILGLSVRN